MLFVAWLLACTGAEAPPAATPGHDHAAMGDGHAGDGHDHSKMDSHADHMTKMSAQRDALRAKLGEAYDKPPVGIEKADAGRGKVVYEQNCMSCHGGTGRGDGPAGGGLPTTPADFTDPFHAKYYADAGRVEIIRSGHPDSGMPAFAGTLTDEQILDVYKYIVTFRAP